MSAPETPAALTRYVVTMRAVVYRSLTIVAASPEEAVRLSEERESDVPAMTPAFKTEAVDEDQEGGDGWHVVGYCEACGVALLDGRDEGRSVDEDGVMLCTPCVAKAVEAAREEGSQ